MFSSQWKIAKNLSCKIICDICASVLLAFWRPSMFYHVSMIVSSRTGIRMIRIYARRIIAGVKQCLSTRELSPFGKFPCNAMSHELSAVLFGTTIVINMGFAGLSASPQPASSKRSVVGMDRPILINFVPKAFFEGNCYETA